MKRKEIAKLLGRYKGLRVTWKRFDCDQDACEECRVCKYLNFLEWANSASPAGSTIQRDSFIDDYLKMRDINF